MNAAPSSAEPASVAASATAQVRGAHRATSSAAPATNTHISTTSAVVRWARAGLSSLPPARISSGWVLAISGANAAATISTPIQSAPTRAPSRTKADLSTRAA